MIIVTPPRVVYSRAVFLGGKTNCAKCLIDSNAYRDYFRTLDSTATEMHRLCNRNANMWHFSSIEVISAMRKPRTVATDRPIVSSAEFLSFVNLYTARHK